MSMFGERGAASKIERVKARSRHQDLLHRTEKNEGVYVDHSLDYALNPPRVARVRAQIDPRYYNQKFKSQRTRLAAHHKIARTARDNPTGLYYAHMLEGAVPEEEDEILAINHGTGRRPRRDVVVVAPLANIKPRPSVSKSRARMPFGSHFDVGY